MVWFKRRFASRSFQTWKHFYGDTALFHQAQYRCSSRSYSIDRSTEKVFYHFSHALLVCRQLLRSDSNEEYLSFCTADGRELLSICNMTAFLRPTSKTTRSISNE